MDRGIRIALDKLRRHPAVGRAAQWAQERLTALVPSPSEQVEPVPPPNERVEPVPPPNERVELVPPPNERAELVPPPNERVEPVPPPNERVEPVPPPNERVAQAPFVRDPLFSSFQPEWLSSLAIKGSREPFAVLGPVDQYLDGEVVTRLDFVPAGSSLEALRRRDPHPLPAPDDREGYHGERHYDWWLSGLSDYFAVTRAAERAGAGLAPGDRVFELGCSSGRALRHFACQGDSLEVWGADIKRRYPEWVTRYLPSSIRVFHNTVYPHLPIEDNSVAVVCAFSVFTHLDDLETAWIAELRRILKPGGIAYLSVHSEHYWNAMGPGWGAYDALLSLKDYISDYPVSAEFLRAPMPSPKVVFWWDLAKVYNLLVFHSTDHIRRVWGRFLEVKEVIPRSHIDQDVVVLQKG